MNDAKMLALLHCEIKHLERTLTEINPDWFVDTSDDYVDGLGLITEPLCLPIRAAIKLLRENKGEKKTMTHEKCKWCFTRIFGEPVGNEKDGKFHTRCYVMWKNRIVAAPDGWRKFLGGALAALSFAMFFALLILSENSDWGWK